MKSPSFKKLKELAAKGGIHKIGDLEIEFFFKRDSKRLESFWFHDQDICEVRYKERVVVGSVQGDMRVQFKEDDDNTYFSGHSAVEYALDNNLTDKHLNKISEFDGWSNNNWIELGLGVDFEKINLKEYSHLFSNDLEKFLKIGKIQKNINKGRNTLGILYFLGDWILNTYDEAIENAVHCAIDDNAWKEQFLEECIRRNI